MVLGGKPASIVQKKINVAHRALALRLRVVMDGICYPDKVCLKEGSRELYSPSGVLSDYFRRLRMLPSVEQREIQVARVWSEEPFISHPHPHPQGLSVSPWLSCLELAL